VKGWSDANPRHVPIAVLIEFKTARCRCPADAAQLTKAAKQQQAAKQADQQRTASAPQARPARRYYRPPPLPWTTSRMDTVDADIRSCPAKD